MKGATASTIGQVSSFVIQTVGTIILARMLTPGDFGLITMVVVINMFVSNITTNAFNDSIVQIEDINHQQVSNIFWINILTSVLFAVILSLSSNLIVSFYKEPRLKAIIISIAVSNVIGSLSVQHLSILKRNIQFVNISVNDIISITISVAVSIILAMCGWGYWSLVAKWMIAPLATTLGAWIICGWRPSFPAKGAGVMPILRFGFHTSGVSIIQGIKKNIDKVLLGRQYGSQALGYYDRAFHLSNMLPSQIMVPLFSVAISTFSKLSNDDDKYRKIFLSVLSLLAFICMPLSAVLTIISRDIILLFLGPQWEEAGQIFFAFGVSIGVMIIWSTSGWLHLSLGKPGRWFRWNIIELLISVLCFIIGLKYGALGMAVSLSASYYIMIGPALWYAGKPIKLSFHSIFINVWKFYVSALFAGLLSWIILYNIVIISSIFIDFNIIIRIIISAVLCIFLYLFNIIVLYRGIGPIRQFIAIIREVFMKNNAYND